MLSLCPLQSVTAFAQNGIETFALPCRNLPTVACQSTRLTLQASTKGRLLPPPLPPWDFAQSTARRQNFSLSVIQHKCVFVQSNRQLLRTAVHRFQKILQKFQYQLFVLQNVVVFRNKVGNFFPLF